MHELKHVIRSCPVIDNHAHNLLRPRLLKSSDFLTITTEATGAALEDTPKSMPHIRALNQLRELYGLPSDADWPAICKRRIELIEQDADSLIKRCLEGTETMLVDDGLGDPSTLETYDWHNKYTTSACKRIVRIETVAADILSSLNQQGSLPLGLGIADEEACSLAWATFVSAFEQAIVASISDPEVVGFKSVVCYRTGLDVQVGKDIDVSEHGMRSFRRHFLPSCEANGFRVEAKGMNDALVISTCKLIAAGHRQTGRAKPLQFHTGLGDKDISLLDSNPACLQPLLEAFPTVPIVLLHSSYPYTREAGYLATVYKNAYLDIGEVFPMVSRAGQETIIRQALELTPTSKLLWSTDGHHFPETYWLANLQGRRALEKVFTEYVQEGDFTAGSAIEAVKDIFFNNSNQLYNLGLNLKVPQEPTAHDPALENQHGKSVMRNTTIPEVMAVKHFDFIFVEWLDYMGTLRTRCIPTKEFQRLSSNGGVLRLGISHGNLGTLQNDEISLVCDPVGQIYVVPDLDTLKPMYQGPLPRHVATVMAGFQSEDGSPLEMCPRSSLEAAVAALRHEYSVSSLVGFEIEVVYCLRNESSTEGFDPLDQNHAWSTFTDEQYMSSYPIMLSTAKQLEVIGISVQQVHSEAGAGQYEFVLPPLPPVQAVDTLIQAKQCIQQVAAHSGLRATCHPIPFASVGSAAHANISFSSQYSADELEKHQMSFMAFVLEHLPGICAFTMPEAVSYGRVADDHWTGGSWVAFGTNNRETPLRRVADAGGNTSRWEVRCMDGTSNMYLALGTVFKAGLAGMRQQKEMKLKDCLSNPSRLTTPEREQLGITEKLPTSFDESLARLENDQELKDAIGSNMADHYISMKRAEQSMLEGMGDKDARVWLMERY